MDYKPLFDRVLVKAISSEQNFGGIIIPDSSSNLKKGEVVAAGAGRPGVRMEVSAGQTVLYAKDSATPVNLDGEQYLILNERDIWMVK